MVTQLHTHTHACIEISKLHVHPMGFKPNTMPSTPFCRGRMVPFEFYVYEWMKFKHIPTLYLTQWDAIMINQHGYRAGVTRSKTKEKSDYDKCTMQLQHNALNEYIQHGSFVFCFFPQRNNNYEVLYIVVDNSLIQVYPPKKKWYKPKWIKTSIEALKSV